MRNRVGMQGHAGGGDTRLLGAGRGKGLASMSSGKWDAARRGVPRAAGGAVAMVSVDETEYWVYACLLNVVSMCLLMPDHTESILRPTLNPQPSTLKVVGHQIMEKYSSRCSWSPQTSALNPKDYGTPDRGGKQKQVDAVPLWFHAGFMPHRGTSLHF